MVMNRQSWDYEGKRMAREKFAQFIISHKKDLSVNLRHAKAVCLPGYDEPSQRSLEIEGVYDKIGIKRKNIVGIERDKEVIEKLDATYPEVEFYHGTDLDFFYENEEKFDIVSLDYCGTLNRGAVLALIALFHKGISDAGILHTNFFAARDRNSERLYDGPLELSSTGVELMKKDLDPTAYSILMDENDKKRNLPLKEKRVDGITEVLTDLARDWAPIGTDFIPEAFRLDKEFNIDDFGTGDTSESAAMRKKSWRNYYKRLVDELGDQYPSNIAPVIIDHIIHRESRPFFCDDLDRYKYQNPKGVWMYGDLLFLNRHKEWFDEKKYPIGIKESDTGKREVIIGNNNAALKNKVVNHIKRINSDITTNAAIYNTTLPERAEITSFCAQKESINDLRKKLFPKPLQKIKDTKRRNRLLRKLNSYIASHYSEILENPNQ